MKSASEPPESNDTPVRATNGPLTGDVPMFTINADPVEALTGDDSGHVSAGQHLPCAKGRTAVGLEFGPQLVRVAHYLCHFVEALLRGWVGRSSGLVVLHSLQDEYDTVTTE